MFYLNYIKYKVLLKIKDYKMCESEKIIVLH